MPTQCKCSPPPPGEATATARRCFTASRMWSRAAPLSSPGLAHGALNIDDYAGATRHLRWDEDMVHLRMLDAYNSREEPLPLDLRQIYWLIGASEDRQREAVQVVLEEFFQRCKDGCRNNRADEEIAKTSEKKEKARRVPASVGRAIAMPTQSDRRANA